MAQTTIIIVELTIITVVVAEIADLVTAVDSAADSAVGGFG